MAQRAIPRPFNPFLPPELMNPTPIGMQPGLMQPSVPPTLASAPRRVPTTVEPVPQALGASAAPAMPPMPAPAPQGGGFMGGVNDFLGSDASLAFAAGLLGGGSTNEAVGRGFGNAFTARQKGAATTDDITEFAFAKQQGYDGSFPDFIAMKKGGSTPADIQEYEYARQQGFQGSFTDYQTAMKKAGAQSITVGDNMKLTEGQSKDVGFYARGMSANSDLSAIENELTSLGGAAASSAGMLGNYAKSPQYQQAERAGREFLAVILRKDTGAAVTPAEFELYGPMYLPQPGDDPATVQDKKEARAGALKSIKLGLGTARPLADEIDAQLGPASTPTAPPAGGWTVEPL